MHPGSPSLVVPLVVLALVGWSIYRRTRSQLVRPSRALLNTVLIVALSTVGLAANARLLSDPLFLEIAPLCLLAGLALGTLMMRTIRFWRDAATGQVWMAGGALYVGIWLATMALRLGVEYLAAGTLPSAAASRISQPPTTLGVLASDLLFLSIGLWLARGYALVRRHRELAR